MCDLGSSSMQMVFLVLNSVLEIVSHFNLHSYTIENLTSTIYFLAN